MAEIVSLLLERLSEHFALAGYKSFSPNIKTRRRKKKLNKKTVGVKFQRAYNPSKRSGLIAPVTVATIHKNDRGLKTNY